MIEPRREAGAPVERRDGDDGGRGRRGHHDDARRSPVDTAAAAADGVWAAGADAGGISTGGCASGLAARSSSAASPPRRPLDASLERPVAGRRRGGSSPGRGDEADLHDHEAARVLDLDRRPGAGGSPVALGELVARRSSRRRGDGRSCRRPSRQIYPAAAAT